MKWDRAWALRIVFGLALAGVAAWFVTHTEWVDVRHPKELPPELADDGTWAARHLLGELGLKALRIDELTTLPPPGATLVLTADYWDLVGRSGAGLRRWVEDGGHLVIDAGLHRAESLKWLPLRWIDPPRDNQPLNTNLCRVLAQRPGLAPAWGNASGFVACTHGWSHLQSTAAPLWALDSRDVGTEVLRVPLGRGRITALASHFNFDSQGQRSVPVAEAAPGLHNFSNRGLLEGDNAALLAALVDARPGAEVWFVTRVQRPPLPLWLWQHAAPALVLAAVALLLALWRGGARFGPLAAVPPPARRGVAAQIRGTADFLFRYRPAALHASSLRALNEAARQHVPGWLRLDAPAQAAALARASGLPEARLAQALRGNRPRHANAWSEDLALLETARRALRDGATANHPKRTR